MYLKKITCRKVIVLHCNHYQEINTEIRQVCYKLNEENKKRELEGLKEAVQKLHRKERTGIIVTFNQQDTLGGFPVMRAYDWLCSNPSNWLINKF